MAEAEGCNFDKGRVVENCLKILQNPTHQNKLKYSTFLNIYRSKFGHSFPVNQNHDDFFASFAVATSSLKPIPWKTPGKVIIKVRPEYARSSNGRRDSATSSSSKEKLVQYTKEHFRYDVSNVLSNSHQDEWLISEFSDAFADFAKRKFPEPRDFGLAKLQDLFGILADICELERKGNQMFIHRLQLPSSSRSRQRKSLNSISNDSVQEVRSPNFHQNIPLLMNIEDPFMPQQTHMDTRQQHDPVQGIQPFMMTVKDYPYAHKILKANDKIKDIVGPLVFSQISDGLKELPFDQLCAMIDDFLFRQGNQLMEFVNYHRQSTNGPSSHVMPNVKVEPDSASSSTALEYISLQSDPTAAQSNLPGVPQANTHDQLHILAERKVQGKRILSEQSVLPRELRSMADIDTACKIIVQNMNGKKEFVSSSKIELALLQYYGKRQLGDFGIGNVRAAHQIETLKNLNMRERKVVLYVELFIKMRSVCTIHEVEHLLIKLQVPDNDTSGNINNNNSSSFEDLYQLGPLYKHPVIYDHFKFPTDGSVQPREINSYHVANIFREYLTKKNLWQSRELQTADFLTFLAETLDVENPWNLGVKIVSLPLLKSTICRAQADSKKEQDKLISQIVNSLVEDMRKESDYLRQQIGKTVGIGSSENQKHINYIKSMSTAELLKHCYKACEPLLQYVDSDTANDSKLNKRKKENKFSEVCRRFQSFFETCQNQPVARAIFELCIISSCKIGNPALIKEAIVFVLDNQKLWEDIVQFCPTECLPRNTSNAASGKPEVFDLTSDSSSEEESELTYKQLEEERERNFLSEIEEKVDELLKEALHSNSNFSLQISLNQLEAMEQSLYKSDSENLLWNRHKMSFLGLIVSRPLLLNKFTSVIGGGISNDNADGNFLKYSSSAELKEFLIQCDTSPGNVDSVAMALKRTFDIDTCDESVRKNICKIVEHNNLQSEKSFIRYGESLTLSEDLTSSVLQKDELTSLALYQIQNIPFMENLLLSLSWNALFRPELGEFVPFLRENKSHCLSHDIKICISCEDCVFKVPAASSYEVLASSALNNEPVNFCALLISLIDTNDGIATFPYQLAQSELYAAFNSLAQYRNLISFLSCAMITLPANFCVPVWRELLKPLAEKVGTVDIEAKLLDRISNQGDKLCLLKLAMLGNQAGIRLWVESATGVPSIESVSKKESSVRRVEPAPNTGNATASFVMDVEISRKVEEPQTQSKFDRIEEKLTMEVDKKQENECRKIVDEILMNEFGEGLQMDEKAREILNKHQDRIGRSLERLSKELYSQDIHFILELIQNADDNFYETASEIGDQPTLLFRLDSEKLAVFNNEDGFRAENLKALCDVGKTTKGKHRKGLIGQKGIGFKSVFRVTDTPEIHSSGFHVRFDVNNGALGMIKPVWIEDENREELLEFEKMKEFLGPQIKSDFTTKIILPLTAQSTNVKAFKTKLLQIEPSLLLFLNKLTRILIQIDVSNENSSEAMTETSMLEREFLNNRIVRVESNESCEFFLVETVSVEVPEHLNVKLEETEISFAFPLEMTAADSFRFSYARTMQAFAFLPVRDFGLKFIVHGDFEIPSSRQDIDCDSAFNQWIAQKIPQLYIDAFEKFLTIIKDPVQAAISFLSYLPLPNEIFGFFKPIAHKTCELVQSACVIPTIENELCVPSQVIQWNELLSGSENIDSELFTKATGWKLAHAHLNKLRPAVVKQLGLHCVSVNDFLVTLEYYTTSQSFENETEVAKVVVVKKLLITILENFSHQLSHDILGRVKKIPFVLLSNGKWVEIQKHTDLFCNTEQDYVSLSKLKMLKLVDSKMLVDNSNKVISEIQKFLINLGVKLSSTKELLKFHVSDVLSNEEKWSTLGTDALRDYTRFLVKGWQNFASGANDLENFLKNLPILICKGGSTEVTQINRSKKTTYFPPKYQPNLCLSEIFPGFTFNTVSDIYLCDYNDAKMFREFFSKVGVREFFDFEKIEMQLSEDGLLKKVDYTSDLVLILEACGKFDQNQAKEIFTLLSHRWNEIMDFVFAREIEAGLQAVKLVPSLVSKALLENSWVPAQLHGKQIFAKSKDLFISTTETKQIFRNDVPVLNQSISLNMIRHEFLNFLCIKTSISVEDVLTYLRKCSQNPEFKSDFAHMLHVYTFLDRNIDECLEVLRTESLVWLPDPSTDGLSFYEPSRLVMDEPSGLYQKYKPTLLKYKMTAPLITFFHEIRQYRYLNMFFEIIGASPVPTEGMYRELMLFLINALDMTKNEPSGKENRISDLFELIALSCHKITDDDACFPCSNRTMASRKDDVILYDQDQHLYSLLKDHENLKILHPDVFNQSTDFQNMILGTALKGKYSLLSDVIKENIISGQIWTCSRAHSFVYFACPYIQRYLSSTYRSVYDRNKESFAQKVSMLKFYACKEFEIIYTYKDSLNVRITKPIFCNGKEFYVTQAHLDDWKLIGKEVAILFSMGNKEWETNLCIFVDLLVRYFHGERGHKNVSTLVDQFEIPNLAEGDPKWNVSKPEYSQIAIDLEISRNRGEAANTSLGDIVENKDGQESKKEGSAKKPGQWPPLPPKGFKAASSGSTGASGNAISELPPPPKPPKDWNATGIRLPPRMVAVEANRAPGSATDALDGDDGVTINFDPSSEAVPSEHAPLLSSDSIPIPGGKRTSQDIVSSPENNCQNSVMSPPRMSAEKKLKTCEDATQPPVLDRGSGKEFFADISESEMKVHRSTTEERQEVKSVNLSVTTPNVAFVSSVTCQLESMDLLSIAGSTSSSALQSIIPPRPWNVQNDGKSLLVGRFGEQLVFNMLRSTAPAGVIVSWVNENSEQYKPFDITVTQPNGGPIDYIEVKATSAPHSDYFPISIQELKFASERGPMYLMYFVFNAMEDKPTVKYFSNLRNKLDTNQVSLLLNLHK